MFKTLILASIAASALATNALPREIYEKLFFEHMQTYGLKIKDGADFSSKLSVFADNLDAINAHNALNLSYKMGLNEFSHMTLAEFHDHLHLGGTRPGNLRRQGSKPYPVPTAEQVSAAPASLDWSTTANPLGYVAVTPVKNQGNCGSCWSFSATGSLESAFMIKSGGKNLQSFSEQELVSCDHTDSGCNGGWMDDAFTWIQGNGGITTEAAYPYTSGTTGQTGSCSSTSGSVAGSAPTGFYDVPASSVDSLVSALQHGAVSIAIQANQVAFQSYSSGVLTGKCGQSLDHGVLAVGYGTLNGIDYWKVKNSWGTSWGQNGYILIEKSSADLCGVLLAASMPTL